MELLIFISIVFVTGFLVYDLIVNRSYEWGTIVRHFKEGGLGYLWMVFDLISILLRVVFIVFIVMGLIGAFTKDAGIAAVE